MQGPRARIRVGNLAKLSRAYGGDLPARVMRELCARLIAAHVPQEAIRLMEGAIDVDLARIWPFSTYSVALADQFWRALYADLGDAPVHCEMGSFYPHLQISLCGLNPHEKPQNNPAPIGVDSPAGQQRHALLELREDAARCTFWLGELRAGRLQLAFQPIYRLGSPEGGACLYHEALLRTVSDGKASPSRAVEALERQGLIARMDWSILWSVISLLETHPASRLGCNVSAITLQPDAWWRELIRYLCSRRAVASRLFIELTETSPVTCLEPTVQLMRELQAVGVRIVLDDLGSGFTALSSPINTRLDVVKIDRRLLERARRDPAGKESLRQLVQACNHCSACIVIEGVETPDDLRLVEEAGAHAAQGYFLGAPDWRPDWNDRMPCVVMNRFKEYLTCHRPE